MVFYVLECSTPCLCFWNMSLYALSALLTFLKIVRIEPVKGKGKLQRHSSLNFISNEFFR